MQIPKTDPMTVEVTGSIHQLGRGLTLVVDTNVTEPPRAIFLALDPSRLGDDEKDCIALTRFDLTEQVTDEDTGFSTGEWDLGGGLAYQYWTSGFRMVAEATYWRLGQPPEVSLEDPLTYRLALGWFLDGGKTLLEGTVYGRTETVTGDGGSHLLGATVERFVRRDRSLYVSAAAGLSETAPDWALIAGMRFVF